MPDTLATVMADTDASQLSAGEGAGSAASLLACRPFPGAMQHDRKAAEAAYGATSHSNALRRPAGGGRCYALSRAPLCPGVGTVLQVRSEHKSIDPHSPAGVPLVRLAAWPARLACDCGASQLHLCSARHCKMLRSVTLHRDI